MKMNKLKFDIINEETIDLGNWNNLWAVIFLESIDTFLGKAIVDDIEYLVDWYRPTLIYDLWMSYTYIISHFSLTMMSFSGCLSIVLLATSFTISHPLASLLVVSSLLVMHTLLLGLAGSRTNGLKLRGKKPALISPVSCLIDTDIIHTTKINSDY